MGRVVPEIMDETIREIISDPYRIIYSTKSSPVTVLTVIHVKRDINKTGKEKNIKRGKRKLAFLISLVA
jgi:plasmid stabilization system protein ParE